jgi:hypothetical protein
MSKLIKFRSPGNKSVIAENADEAALIYANRVARRYYGKLGRVASFYATGWAFDGSHVTYNAFIGKPSESGGIGGRNILVRADVDRKEVKLL